MHTSTTYLFYGTFYQVDSAIAQYYCTYALYGPALLHFSGTPSHLNTFRNQEICRHISLILLIARLCWSMVSCFW